MLLTGLVPVTALVVLVTRQPGQWMTALAVAVFLTASLALRERRPVIAVALATATQAALVWLGVPVLGAAALVIVLFAASTRLAPPALAVITGASVVALAAAEIGWSDLRGEKADVIPLLLVFTFGVAGGLAWRYYRSYVAATADEAAALERSRGFERRLALSRELHDALGHQLAVINLQAQVATRLMRTDPARAEQSLTHVSEATRAALAELGELVARLRDDTASLAPADLVALRRSFAATGQLDSFEIADLPTLTETTSRALYRVIQEGLTNASRHAPSARVSVRVRQQGNVVDVLVANTAAPEPAEPRPAEQGGHGLVGLRERVEGLGGTLDAAPRAEGGFEVHARLPIGTRP